ncbi:MAG: putative cytokinetic ring protein SteA [Armatimonadota bacterium]|nr:putative cytokinetic ring protein SteA [Armatimonadota bacterium]MCX7776858.1 putative cytokinetic ring protein SteA [Armatimonadota bacterium]MDW8024456.1 putative cytokinetic ring protein SteA [Armatimonadota bacterium]
MKGVIRAPVRLDRRTKRLVRRLRQGEIALIDHEDIDVIAAHSLIEAGASVVINVSNSATGNLPPEGAEFLLSHSIPLIDQMDERAFELLQDGKVVEVNVLTGELKFDGIVLRGKPLTADELSSRREAFSKRISEVIEAFVKNTLDYIQREGKELLSGKIAPPQLKTKLRGRHVLIVTRGRGYKDDLKAIMPYVRDERPVLIGVNGGADALLEFGLKPDIVFGDMDSVSEKALKCATDIVVHAYPDGSAPGLDRLKGLGLNAVTFSVHGTSEDAAMLLAYACGASLIIAIGTHTSFVEFLEKGRKGMASTFLTRLRLGHLLVDAKGVSQLYSERLKLWHIVVLLMLGAISALIIAKLSPYTVSFLRAIALWFVVRFERLFNLMF